MVNKHTGQAVADGALHDGGGDGRIHPTREAADRATILADLGAYGVDKLLSNVRRGPILLQPGNLGEKANQHLLAVRGVHYLRVVLHPSHATFEVFKSSDRCTRRLSCHSKPFGSGGNGITVAHPHLVRLLKPLVQQTAVNSHVSATIFTVTRVSHRAAQRMRHSLETITNAKNRNIEIKNPGIKRWCTLGIDRRRAARKNQGSRVFSFNILSGCCVGNNLRINPGFTHTARNKLCILRAEINNKNGAMSLLCHATRFYFITPQPPLLLSDSNGTVVDLNVQCQLLARSALIVGLVAGGR